MGSYRASIVIILVFIWPFFTTVAKATGGCIYSISKVHESILAVEDRLTKELGGRFSTLSRHPGIVEKLDDFIRFAKNRIEPSTTVSEILDDYRQQGGRVTLYRGLALTEEEAEGILRNGLTTGFIYKQGGNYTEGVMKFESLGLDRAKAEYASDQGGAAKSVFAATGVDNFLAKYVANAMVNDPANQKIYIFQFDLWKADVVSVSDQEKLFFLEIPPSELTLKSKSIPNYEPYIPSEQRPWWDW